MLTQLNDDDILFANHEAIERWRFPGGVDRALFLGREEKRERPEIRLLR